MRSLVALVVAALAACGGDDNTKVIPDAGSAATITPTASGIFPANAFSGRSARIQISGDATMFTDATTVDFGPGITVVDVAAASPTDLFADIAIDPTATLGPRDVAVTNGAGTYTLTKAFVVEPPIEVTVSGSYAQGSIATIHVKNRDLANPFDSTCTYAVTPCFDYANTFITVTAHMRGTVTFVDDDHIDATVMLDTDAVDAAIEVQTGPDHNAPVLSDSAVVPVAPRTAIEATPTATAVTLADPGDSALYAVTVNAGVARAVFQTAVGSQSQVYLLTSEGKFDFYASTATADATGKITVEGYTKDPETFYAVYVDDGLGKPVTVQTTDFVPLVSITETEPNDSLAQAQNIAALPATVQTGTFSSATDADYVKFTVAAGDAGRRIRVMTGGLADLTYTVVEAFSANGTSLGVSNSLSNFVDYQSAPVAAGVNYVKISSLFWDAAHTAYDAAIYLY